MESAVLDQVSVDVAGGPGNRTIFRATGSVITFDGFLKLYQEDRDDPDEEDEQNRRLPPMRQGEAMERGAVRPEQHFTQPPPRYTEASLVKKLEELGIGRPSTYASIIQVLQDRDYVKLEKKRFQPEDRGRLVTAFLTSFFERYVQYNFTADLENELDEISGGRADWKAVLRDFWRDFSTAIAGTKDLTITQVIQALDEHLGRHFFPEDGTGRDPRLCPGCNAGRLSLKLGKFGAFIGCSNYPECRYTRPLGIEGIGDTDATEAGDNGPRELGTDPGTGLLVTVKKGPYGHYVQVGEGGGEEKPKRVSLPKGLKPADIDLDTALRLLALPREVGRHPESGETILAGIGRYGPYVKHGKVFKSLAADDDVLAIGINRAVSLLAEQGGRGQRPKAEPLRVIGQHPESGETLAIQKGRFGPYIAHQRVFATVPRTVPIEDVTIEQALEWLAAKAGKSAGKKPARGAAKAAAPKTKAASSKKPASSKKASARKSTAKQTDSEAAE
jgi:DNA topoisomerase-1